MKLKYIYFVILSICIGVLVTYAIHRSFSTEPKIGFKDNKIIDSVIRYDPIKIGLTDFDNMGGYIILRDTGLYEVHGAAKRIICRIPNVVEWDRRGTVYYDTTIWNSMIKSIDTSYSLSRPINVDTFTRVIKRR